MKITGPLRKQINEAVRTHTRGANPLAEVGLRGENWKPNALLWSEEDDLGDLIRLAELFEIDDDPANPGCAMLDIYATTGINNRAGFGRELETNVIILIREGAVIGATSEGAKVDALVARLGFPAGRGW